MRNPNDQGRTITHIPIVDHGTYREQCPTRCLFSKGSQQGPASFQQNFPVLGHVGSMWVRMNDSWWFQTCSKKMIPVPIVPDISVITPTERHIFLGFVGDGKLNQGFSKNTCRVHCLRFWCNRCIGFPPSEWPWSKAPHPQDAICHTSWSEAPGALDWYLGLGSTPFYRHEPGTLQYNDNI